MGNYIKYRVCIESLFVNGGTKSVPCIRYHTPSFYVVQPIGPHIAFNLFAGSSDFLEQNDDTTYWRGCSTWAVALDIARPVTIMYVSPIPT